MMRPPNRYQRGRLHLINDVEFVICPICGKKMQFLHWKHLKKHRKTLKDIRREYPSVPTMTRNESHRRREARKNCNAKILKTCKNKYGGIGFASDSLEKKSRDKIEKVYGNRNIMKTEHGKKYFKGKLNPLKNPNIAKKVSSKLKGQPSPLKGKTYEEILGEERTKKRKKELKRSGAYGQSITPRISAPQLKLFQMVKEKYPTAILEYPVLDYCLDIAVPDLKLCFEYDGSYWHDKERDKKRDEVLEKMGWKVIRFVDNLPESI